MFKLPEELSPEMTILALVLPAEKFTSDVVGTVVALYIVRYPLPVPSVALRLPTTAVASVGIFASPATCTVMELPPGIAVSVAFTLGRFSDGQ
jgi:hypothetical protein